MFDEEITKHFIGHAKELEIFEKWLVHPDDPWILFFHDAASAPEKKGGVGKTWLLRKCVNVARDRFKDVAIVVIDFFNVEDRDSVEIAERIVKSLQEVHPEWFPTLFTQALTEYREAHSNNIDVASLHEKLHIALSQDMRDLDQQMRHSNRQLLIFFDTYEVIEAYPTVATLSSIHGFPDRYHFGHMGVVIAGRNAPDWEHPSWKTHAREEVQCVPINPFTYEEMVQFINDNLTTPSPLIKGTSQAQILYTNTEGRPILTGLVTDVLNNHVMTLDELLRVPKNKFEISLVERINSLDKPINLVILFMAHIYHRFNESLLTWLFNSSQDIKDLMQDVQINNLTKKLLTLSFVRRSGSGDNLALHDEMRRLVNKYNWPVQEQQTKRYRRELSLGTISYYQHQIAHERSEPIRQTYQVEMLYHKLYVDVNEGFAFFEQRIKRANDLWQNSFARSLLQEVQQFIAELSPGQRHDMIMAEAGLLHREGANRAALELYMQLEREGDEAWLKTHQADILFQKGECYQQLDRISEAKTSFNNCKELEVRKGNEPRVATILSRLGVIETRTGNLTQAEEFYEQGIAIRKKRGDLRGYANTLNSLGGLYRLQGRTEDALRHCKVALRIRKDLFEKNEASEVAVGMSLGTIGVIYLKIDDFVKAERLFNEAFSIFERYNYKKGIAAMYNRFGQIAMARDDLEEATRLFKQGYDASVEFDAESEINSLNKQGWVHVLRGQLQEAILLLEKAIARAHEVSDYYQEAESLIDLADVFERLEQSEASKHMLRKAETIAKSFNYYYLLGITQQFQGDNRYKAGKYRSAFRYFGEYCHYMALFNSVQYEKAVRRTIDLLLDVPKEELAPILNELTMQWSSFKLGERAVVMLNALEEVRMLTDILGPAI